jgi:hypothetical protein
MVRIAQEEGLLALWKGTSAALLREASYSSIRMGAYEPLKEVSARLLSFLTMSAKRHCDECD